MESRRFKRIADVTTHAALQSYEDDLTDYLIKLTDSNSEEYKEVREQIGDWIRGPIGYSGISARDLCILFLKQLAIKVENENKSGI